MSSPTRRTLILLRQQGYLAEVVERWVPGANVRRDLFHCIDVVAVHPALSGTLGVQCTTKTNLAARVEKVRQQSEIAIWLRAGNRLECWGWYRRARKWDVERVEIKAEDLQPVLLTPRRRPRRPRKGERQRGLFDQQSTG
jgi:hypothetical protein